MRKWNSFRDLELLDRIFTALRKQKLLEPGTIAADDPVDLRGMSFPTVTMCKELELPTLIVSRIAGRQEFYEATIRKVDFSKARLDFSVWHDCHFEQVMFNSAKLHNVRFFGCRFEACSFRSVELKGASFSVGNNGRETEVINTIFEKANFQGASSCNPVLRSTSFIDCKMSGFVLDGPLCDNVNIVGKYKDITIRGVPGEPCRNRLHIDFSNANLVWLNADYGIDLTLAILPKDRSCFVITDRLRAVNCLCERLPKELGDIGNRVASVLKSLFSNRAISPLESSQTTFLISYGMIADFMENTNKDVVMPMFTRIRSIADQEGFLANNNTTIA